MLLCHFTGLLCNRKHSALGAGELWLPSLSEEPSSDRRLQQPSLTQVLCCSIPGCEFQPVPLAGLSRAGCNICPACKIPVRFQHCHSLLTTSLFCCASEVHLITFPPFSLGAGDLHSLHLNQISGTSILRRLRRRKHQYFTEHKKLHNSQFLFWCQLWLVGHISFFL